MVDNGGGPARGPTPDEVADDEPLDRWFLPQDLQDEKVASSRFRSEEVSVYRARYKPTDELVDEATESEGIVVGVAQLTATAVRSNEGLDVVKDEEPYAHAVIRRQGGGRISKSAARRMRDAAQIVRMPG